MYDIIDNKDHPAIQATLAKGCTKPGERREFLCRININKNARRQMRFGDQKLVLVSGHFHHFLPLFMAELPVFIAHCSPIAMPETRECVAQGNCQVFTSLHGLDMRLLHLDRK